MAIYNKITVFTTLPINGETSVSFVTKLQVGKFTELNNMMVTSEAVEVSDEE